MRKITLRALLLLALSGGFAIVVQFMPPPAAPPITLVLERAAWIGVEWAMDAHSDAELQSFAAELQSRRIKYAYLYVSYLKADGVFNPTYTHAQTMTRVLHEIAPEIILLAWIGVPIQGTDIAGNNINRLDNPAIRAHIADFAAMTVRDLGFEGVHLNAELIPDGDSAYLSTLSDIRSQLPTGTLFSATAHALRLTRPTTFVPYPVMVHHWSIEYLRAVASRTDQIALMAYDSGLPFPADYRRWMAYQVRESTDMLAGIDCELIIGIPTSEEWTVSHQTQAETLDAALWGIQAGIAESVSPETLAGIAVYPYWETSEEEWLQVNASLDGWNFTRSTRADQPAAGLRTRGRRSQAE